ncbi:glycosyltransferase [Sphingobium sp. 3R8]|uniref:glycosyltransferase n=1 Tax=Sphingobium sp. 3R8 TaxID=2874921 RepID=UPI001CCBDB58|nr:glycosyltransferase [Sphingobium sp. 3R8]MBZ9649273.1 glycosyltransferase [Sphingobium sp. 3R8]
MPIPRLSIIMPVHEGDAYLDAALASLPDDANGLIEVIALDSSSTMRCRDIAARHAGRLTLRYEYRPDILSWTAKTNRAAAMARAPHVAMLHQDDLWLPDRLTAILAALDADPDAAMLLTAATIIDEGGRTLGRWRCPLEGRSSWEGPAVMERLLVQNFVALPSVVMRRDIWKDAGGLDESLWYTPDWDIYMKAAMRGRVSYLAEPTVAFRIHGGSQTMLGSRTPADFLNQMEIVVARYAPVIAGPKAKTIRHIAAASARINCLLAEVMHGRTAALAQIMGELLRLGPWGVWRYMSHSRIIDRVLPRIHARLRGAL